CASPWATTSAIADMLLISVTLDSMAGGRAGASARGGNWLEPARPQASGRTSRARWRGVCMVFLQKMVEQWVGVAAAWTAWPRCADRAVCHGNACGPAPAWRDAWAILKARSDRIERMDQDGLPLSVAEARTLGCLIEK